MANYNDLDSCLRALESILDEDGTPIDNETEVISVTETDPVEMNPASPANAKSAVSQDVTSLVAKARERMDAKFTTIESAKDALMAVISQVEKINGCLAAMAKCSKDYADGNIDDKVRCATIRDNMEELRSPVKELQLQMGREVDKDSTVTEAELRDFRDYLEGFISAIRDRIACLKNERHNVMESDNDPDICPVCGKPLEECKCKSEKEMEQKKTEDKNEEASGKSPKEIDEEKEDAMEFASACESLMIRVEDEEDSIESVIESLIDTLTDL